MRATISADNEAVLVIPESVQETTYLASFPGLLRHGPSFFMPAKRNVVVNVLGRLMKAVKGLKVGKQVADLYSSSNKLNDIPSDFHFFTKPKIYQEIALRFLLTNKSGGLLLDPGMGKTKVYLDYVAAAGFDKVLIVCPKALRFVWMDEVAVHRPDKSIYVVDSTKWEDEIEGITNATIVVVNYDKAVTLEANLAKVGFNAICLDEGLIKDYTTNRTKALTRLSKVIPVRNLMSGTLVNNSPVDAFAPLRFMEPSICGEYITPFKSRYCVTNQKNPNIIFGYKNTHEIRGMIDSVGIVMTKDEWLELPPKVFNQVLVPMGEDQRQAFWDLKSNYLINVQGTEISVDTPLVLASKLSQISNGFIYHNPEADELSLDELFGRESKAPVRKAKAAKQVIRFQSQPKADKMIELLTGKLSDRKAIIWYNMTAERDIIVEYLEKAGISHEVICGGEKDVGGKVRKFNRTPALRCLVCQAKSVNYGITVMGTSRDKLEELEIEPVPNIAPEVFTQIFYSLSFSLEMFLQQQDRIHRLGQERECEYYLLLAMNPMETRVYDALQDKMDIRKELLVDIISKMSNSVQ